MKGSKTLLRVNYTLVILSSCFLLCLGKHISRVHTPVENSILKSENQNVEEVTYVGSVIEYESYKEWTDEEKGYGIVRKNAQAIAQFAKQAKTEYGADIIVSPEYGMTSLIALQFTGENFTTFAQYVPDPAQGDVTPCHMAEGISNMEGLKIISCAAIENEMYLAVNVAEMLPCSPATVGNAPWPVEPQDGCPEIGYFFYNCEVVFDRQGTVIARYRKQHLFHEDIMTPGPKDDVYAMFLTDFNVLFTMQICFDIGFTHPGHDNVKYLGIRDVVMSTAWHDYLPFGTADQVQNGWSRALHTNLLVSGFHYPEMGKLGSGVYRGYSGKPPVYTYNKDSGSVLVAATVTTVKASELMPRLIASKTDSKFHRNSRLQKEIADVIPLTKDSEVPRKHKIVHESLDDYTKVLLNQTTQGAVSVSACSGEGFCCTLNYEYYGDQIYMFVVNSGKFVVDSRYSIGEQVCGVLWCQTRDYKTCAIADEELRADDHFGPLSMESTTYKAETVTAGGNHRDLSLISNDKIDYEESRKRHFVNVKDSLTSPMTIAMYGRWYCEDEW